MALPRFGKSDGGMLGGIKSKLGFGGAHEEYDEESYYDDYDEGYEDDYSPAGRKDSYDSMRSSTSRRGDAGSSPRLVSIDDVRANTQIPDSLKRDPLPQRQASSSAYATNSTSGYRSGFSGSSRQVERAADYLRSTDTSDLVKSITSQRSEGLDSLFASTAEAANSSSYASSASTSKTFDPYEAYEGAGQAAHNPTRSLSVLKPANYGDAERVAKIIKAGDVVVLSLRNTPDHLAKRILDFSFGVSSALDASVECVADKVFVVLRGNQLSAEELTALRSQGVL